MIWVIERQKEKDIPRWTKLRKTFQTGFGEPESAASSDAPVGEHTSEMFFCVFLLFGLNATENKLSQFFRIEQRPQNGLSAKMKFVWNNLNTKWECKSELAILLCSFFIWWMLNLCQHNESVVHPKWVTLQLLHGKGKMQSSAEWHHLPPHKWHPVSQCLLAQESILHTATMKPWFVRNVLLYSLFWSDGLSNVQTHCKKIKSHDGHACPLVQYCLYPILQRNSLQHNVFSIV